MDKSVDIIQFLNDYEITYFTSGKNVAKNSVNIRCYNCDDRSNHLSIKLGTGKAKCWRCGHFAYFIGLIQHFDGCEYWEAKKLKKKYETNDIIVNVTEKKEYVEKDITSFKMPYGIDNFLHDIHKDYLRSRNFDVEEITKKFGLMSCLNKNPKYKFRIIIPIFYNNHIVSFIARDVTDSQYVKYQDLEEKYVVIPKARTIFNLDTVDKNGIMVITEGPLDVFRGGDGFVATMSINFTTEQINLIRKKNPKRIFLAFDNEELAGEKAEELERYLYFCPDLNYVEFPDYANDIGDFKIDDIKHLRSMIF